MWKVQIDWLATIYQVCTSSYKRTHLSVLQYCTAKFCMLNTTVSVMKKIWACWLTFRLPRSGKRWGSGGRRWRGSKNNPIWKRQWISKMNNSIQNFYFYIKVSSSVIFPPLFWFRMVFALWANIELKIGNRILNTLRPQKKGTWKNIEANILNGRNVV